MTTELVYRHYKGGHYRTLMHATDANTGQPVVVYESLDNGRVYTRDWEEFHSLVEPQHVPRFTLIQ